MANEKRRLIDANALVETIVNTPSEVAQIHTYNVLSSLAERQHEILNIIDNAPTVDAVEVVHGRWHDVALRYTEVKEECSVCHGVVRVHGFRYCPNCGAKMDGERREGE